jgi:cobalt-zinc-cadmium resistance protein CzcA
VKGANSVKIFGPDLATLVQRRQAEGRDAEGAGHHRSGRVPVAGPAHRAHRHRPREGRRYGILPDDINAVVQAAIGGQSPGDLYEKGTDRHFSIMVRLKAEQRDSLEAIRRIPVGVTNPNGGMMQVPLSELADIKLTTGASFIYREHQERYVPIKFSVRNRDLGSAVGEAQARIQKNVILPPGYHLEWAGEMGNLTNAVHRLEIVVPISLLLIFGLLMANFRSFRDSMLAFSVIPMAIIGGVMALALTGTAFSISAAIGFVALFGIAVMDGILVVTTFNQALNEGSSRSEARHDRLELPASGGDDLSGCRHRPAACRRCHGHRFAGAEAAGAGGGGRHDAGPDPDPVGAAGADREVQPSRWPQ